MTILTDSLVPLYALLIWLRIQVVDTRFILNNKLWNKFLLGHIRIVREVLQKLSNDTDVTQQKFISQLVIQDETCIHHLDFES